MTNAAICRECPHPKTNRKPWLYRHTCIHCVEEFAERHRTETGHAVELNIICIDNILIKRPDTRTNRITARKGWRHGLGQSH